MFCWPCIIVHQYSETNVIHCLCSLLRIKDLYIFRALLLHPQEALLKRHLVYCVRFMSVGCIWYMIMIIIIIIIIIIISIIIFWLCCSARAMASSYHEVSWLHTATRHSRCNYSERMISSQQRPLPQNTQQTNVHVPGGIRTHDRSLEYNSIVTWCACAPRH
jgi:uncharacterized membrane protein